MFSRANPPLVVSTDKIRKHECSYKQIDLVGILDITPTRWTHTSLDARWHWEWRGVDSFHLDMAWESGQSSCNRDPEVGQPDMYGRLPIFEPRWRSRPAWARQRVIVGVSGHRGRYRLIVTSEQPMGPDRRIETVILMRVIDVLERAGLVKQSVIVQEGLDWQYYSEIVLVEVINVKVHSRHARARLQMLVNVVRKRMMVCMSSMKVGVGVVHDQVLVRVTINPVIVPNRHPRPSPTNARVGGYALTVILVSTLAYNGRRSWFVVPIRSFGIKQQRVDPA